MTDRQRQPSRCGAHCLNEPLLDSLVDQLLHAAARQFEPLGEIENRLAALDQHELKHQVEEAALRNAGLFETGGHRRRCVHDFGQLLGREQPHRDQIVAKPAAFGQLARQRRLDIGGV
jgi:hypothetical protein